MTPNYHQKFVLLQESITKLSSNTQSLSDAVQEYAKGTESKSACVEILNALELQSQLIESEVTASEFSLEEVFEQLESLESQIELLPDTHLEKLLELMKVAEKLISTGENHIHQMKRSLKDEEHPNV